MQGFAVARLDFVMSYTSACNQRQTFQRTEYCLGIQTGFVEVFFGNGVIETFVSGAGVLKYAVIRQSAETV